MQQLYNIIGYNIILEILFPLASSQINEYNHVIASSEVRMLHNDNNNYEHNSHIMMHEDLTCSATIICH